MFKRCGKDSRDLLRLEWIPFKRLSNTMMQQKKRVETETADTKNKENENEEREAKPKKELDKKKLERSPRQAKIED